MSKAIANEVIASEHGLVVVGSKGPGTRVWFLPKQKTKASERLIEFSLRWEPPRGTPAAILPSGKLLVVGRNCESLTLEPGRSAQPGPLIGNAVIEGVSPEGVAFGRGPVFFRYVEGAWVNESPPREDLTFKERLASSRSVRAVSGELAVGDEVWLSAKPVTVKTKARFNCIAGNWVGGDKVVLERKGKTFTQHTVAGNVTSIAEWGKRVLLLINGVIVDLKGTPVKAPPEIESFSAHDGTFWCVSRGALFQSTDLKRFTRKVLPAR
jgi:hypothetical protein